MKNYFLTALVTLILLIIGFNIINKVSYNYSIKIGDYKLKCLFFHPYLSIKNNFMECAY